MKNHQLQKITKLRFPEFSDKWKKQLFGNTFEFLRTNSFSRAELTDKGKVMNIHYGDIHTSLGSHFNLREKKVSYLSNKDNSDFIENGDLVIADASEDRFDVGKSTEVVNIENTRIVAGLHTFLARPKNLAIGYSGFLMQSKHVRKYLWKIATGASVLGISKTELSKLEILIPSYSEQQKIADFLTAVDDRISAIQEKVELLKEYKKGVMQKIFSQEIRFRDDDRKDYPAWIETKVGDVYKERQERYEEGLDLLSVTMNDGIKKRADIGGKDNSSSDKYNYKRVYKGDIVYNSMRMWQGASGVTDYNGVVSPAYTVLERNNSHVSKFFGYYFKLPKMIHTFERYSQGLTSDTWNLKYPQISKIKIIIPSAKEQRKIADFLIAIDDKIQLEERRLAEAKKFKKSLLQQMFV